MTMIAKRAKLTGRRKRISYSRREAVMSKNKTTKARAGIERENKAKKGNEASFDWRWWIDSPVMVEGEVVEAVGVVDEEEKEGRVGGTFWSLRNGQLRNTTHTTSRKGN